MDCRTAQTLLDPYLDGELERADARELELHVDNCADCHANLASRDELHRALRDGSLRYTAPPSLRDRIRDSADNVGDADNHVASARRRLPVSRLAAACVLAFAAGAASLHLWTSLQSTSGAQTQLSRDLFASHWRALAAASPVDVISSDRHTVKPWFAGKVAEAPPVKDFAEQGFALVGGRIDYVGRERVPVLVYRHGPHLIDVFMLPQANGLQALENSGYGLDVVALGGESAVIVTDMDRAEIARFGELLTAKP